MMPGMDGFKVCEKLKSDARTRDIPVLFISALHETEDKIRGFQAGGVDFITKPFNAGEVLARVETHLVLRNLQTKIQEQNVQLKDEIEERKKAENRVQKALHEKEMLLKEIHHRIKNNLQAAASLLNLQASRLADGKAQSAIRESENRILSMALIHEQLQQIEDTARVHAGDYVKTLVERLFETYGVSPEKIRLSVRATDTTLNNDTAVPMGLIINELVSNSLKYAFPGNKKGEIRVSLTRDQDGTFCLKVADDGVGLPDDVEMGKSGSLGMLLVKGFAEGLSGAVEFSRNGGTAVTITFREYLENGIDQG
jgi:two-component sensor histidine kinase